MREREKKVYNNVPFIYDDYDEDDNTNDDYDDDDYDDEKVPDCRFSNKYAHTLWKNVHISIFELSQTKQMLLSSSNIRRGKRRYKKKIL